MKKLAAADLGERARRLGELVAWRFDGNRAALGRALGHVDGSFVRRMMSGASPITEKTVRRIEALPGLERWFETGAPIGVGEPPEPGAANNGSPAEAPTTVPVLGTSRTGPTRALDWPEPWPLQDGDQYVEAFVSHRHAYALRVSGDDLTPRSLDGEWLVVTPSALPSPGDEVLLKTRDGAVSVRQIVASYDDHILLIGVAPGAVQASRRKADLEFVHTIGMHLPMRAGLRFIDRGGYRGADRRVRRLPVLEERRRAE